MGATTVTIAGGGLSGLTAAMTVARRGGRAVVVERRRDSGARFHGDFQGLENWSTPGDVIEELGSMGVENSFDHTPFHGCVFFDPEGREYDCRSADPLWYLVRRGTEPGTLDQALKAQAVALGVEIEYGRAIDHLPEGGIVAHGPRHADAIAVGYVFPTDRPDGAFAAVSDELAPGGYAYLLVCRGRATLATCMFDDFHNERRYLDRTVEFFQHRLGVASMDGTRFGGFGNTMAEPTVRRGRLLFAGEAAGLQDALFGFGMRYALTSGYLAGCAWADGNLASYERAYRHHLYPRMRAAEVNRHLYARGGHRAYRALVRRVTGAADPRAWLRRHYSGAWWTPLVYAWVKRDARRRRPRTAAVDCRHDCDCTYCRCVRDAERQAAGSPDAMSREAAGVT